jgi:hypothetical protein
MLKFVFNILLLIFVVIGLCRCLGDVHNQELNGGYYISALDLSEEMHIGYNDSQYGGIGVIEATVYAVGQNEDYIIVKQHPKSDQKTTHYFIIPLKTKISQSVEKNFFGPLTFNEFNTKKRELNIYGIDFSIIFEDLE